MNRKSVREWLNFLQRKSSIELSWFHGNMQSKSHGIGLYTSGLKKIQSSRLNRILVHFLRSLRLRQWSEVARNQTIIHSTLSSINPGFRFFPIHHNDLQNTHENNKIILQVGFCRVSRVYSLMTVYLVWSVGRVQFVLSCLMKQEVSSPIWTKVLQK